MTVFIPLVSETDMEADNIGARLVAWMDVPVSSHFLVDFVPVRRQTCAVKATFNDPICTRMGFLIYSNYIVQSTFAS